LKKRIFITGGSGTGKTSIGEAVCEKIGYKHFDTDSYLWLPTKEPFMETRTPDEYSSLMGKDLINNEKWILTGHVSFGLGHVYMPLYELVVFMYIPPDVRMERLKKREYERYGDEILPSGSKYENSKEFLQYAIEYETGTTPGSLQGQKKFLESVKCPVLKIANDSFEESVNTLLEAISSLLA